MSTVTWGVLMPDYVGTDVRNRYVYTCPSPSNDSITHKEFMTTVNNNDHMKKRKAAGPDDIPAEV